MFTGIVEALASVIEVRPEPPGVRIAIRIPQNPGDSRPAVRTGDSIALNGCCLTAVAIDADRLQFQAGEETLRRTNLGRLQPGSSVNIERSLSFRDPLGGHFVTGHIDGQGILESRADAGQWSIFWFHAPTQLMRQMASKGSIAIDGVSLTLVNVKDDRFSVMLIPHTLAVTTLGRLQSGDSVNLETDVLAKYVQRQLATDPNEHI
jgi:riboflavin synthase